MRNLTAAFLLLSASGLAGAAPPPYELRKTVPVPGDGGWDYLIVDDAGRLQALARFDTTDQLLRPQQVFCVDDSNVT